MLFKFKSKAASDLIMMEDDARRLLLIMRGEDPVKGIVQCPDLPKAIAALEAAVLQENERLKQAQAKPQTPAQEAQAQATPHAVGLAQRAAPMLKLLKISLAQNADVVWGV